MLWSGWLLWKKGKNEGARENEKGGKEKMHKKELKLYNAPPADHLHEKYFISKVGEVWK